MRPTPNNLGQNKFPPNPKQWAAERNGHKLRARFGKSLHVPLEPFEIAHQFDGVELLERAGVESIVGSECADRIYGRHRNVWSGFAIPVAGKHLVVVNSTHSRTRQQATLMEELFHITLGHVPMRIMPCPVTGILKREFSPEIEEDARFSAAAALVPYGPLKGMFTSGGTAESIAEWFGVSVQLVQFRLQVTRIVRRRKR
jgi:hypothetical protein